MSKHSKRINVFMLITLCVRSLNLNHTFALASLCVSLSLSVYVRNVWSLKLSAMKSMSMNLTSHVKTLNSQYAIYISKYRFILVSKPQKPCLFHRFLHLTVHWHCFARSHTLTNVNDFVCNFNPKANVSNIWEKGVQMWLECATVKAACALLYGIKQTSQIRTTKLKLLHCSMSISIFQPNHISHVIASILLYLQKEISANKNCCN